MNDRLRKLLRYLLARMREPSTAAGIATLAAMFHHTIPDETVAGLVLIFGGVASVSAILVPELASDRQDGGQ